MYKVISINEYAMTRDVELINIDTMTTEKCFDDSALISDVNFEFLEIGKIYECKIALFGAVVSEKSSNALICKIVSKNEIVGTTKMVRVMVGEDEYYILRNDVLNVIDKKTFYFDCTRKDLIQVGNVIHNDLM